MRSTNHSIFPNLILPWLLITPQLIITIIFFLWPASKILWYSFHSVDSFGFCHNFVGLDNFYYLFKDKNYLASFTTTFWLTGLITIIGIILALLFAAFVNYTYKSKRLYQTLFLIPYAVPPAVAAVLWLFLYNPGLGICTYWLHNIIGYEWNHFIYAGQAMFLVIIIAIWKQISYNFLLCFTALRSIPYVLLEAAAIDGAGPIRRFFQLSLPLMSPVIFFLLIINLVYAFFDTFPTIDATTAGGPVQATTTLIYKIYRDGFLGLDLASASAQSVILMLLVIILTIIQFYFIEHKVHYQ